MAVINDQSADDAVAGQRHIHLDVLRGFAVMGILTVNIGAFAFPQNAYFTPAFFGMPSGSDIAVWMGDFILFDGKMRGLFSLLFGASMMLIMTLAQSKGESPAKTHYNRMIWLMIFGLLHFIFIWFGDILFLYAVMGCIAFAARDMSAKRLLKWGGGIFLSVALLLTAALSGLLFQKYAAQQPNASQTEIDTHAEFTSSFSQDSEASIVETAAYNGSYFEAISYRISEEWSTPLIAIFIGFIETLPLMMIGMALLKNGFLLGQSPVIIYRRTALIGLGGGAILTALLSIIIIRSNFDLAIIFNAQQAWGVIPRLMMTIGYAALIIMIIARFQNSEFIIRTGAAGRMAFSNYIGTSIIMSLIFYGYGFGLFGELSRLQLIPIVIGTWAIMLLWSKPWLMRFQYGPLEWLWRSLSRRRLQKFKR